MAFGLEEFSHRDVWVYFKNIRYNTDENTFYIQNNWFKEANYAGDLVSDPAIPKEVNLIDLKQGAIWLTSNGDICYRLSPLGKVHTAPISKINIIFSNFLNLNFTISQTVPKVLFMSKIKKLLNDENKFILHINQLLLVEAEKFNPHITQEFYYNKIDRLFYRNTFKPSSFLQIFPTISYDSYTQVNTRYNIYPKQAENPYEYRPDKSITLQYIYYLCNYNTDRFKWLINWLASFLKNLSNRSDSILVLYGSSNAGTDILFNHIISPLFGKEYTFKITNNTPIGKYDSKFVNEKLFYNINNISQSTADNEKTTVFLQKLLPENQKYAQLLITTDEPIIPYNNIDNYTVFHVSQVIDKIYIPDWFNPSDKTKMSKQKLIDSISDDLKNFAHTLKVYPSNQESHHPFVGDDKNFINNTLEDKLKAFVDAIKKMDMNYFKPLQNENHNLYSELKKDFDRHLIQQPNLKKSFNILYPDDKFESRTLMKQLRSIDELFLTKNVKSYTAGKKYFKIP